MMYHYTISATSLVLFTAAAVTAPAMKAPTAQSGGTSIPANAIPLGSADFSLYAVGTEAYTKPSDILDQFWLDAWALPYDIDSSGIQLIPSPTSTMIAVADGNRQLTGAYRQLAEMATDSLVNDTTGVAGVDSFYRTVSVGEFSGSTGYRTFTYGLRYHVTVSGDSDGSTLTRDFDFYVPYGIEASSVDAMTLGTMLFNSFDSGDQQRGFTSRSSSSDSALEQCLEIARNRRDGLRQAARTAFRGCVKSATGGSIIAAVACGITGPLVVPCLLSVVGGDVLILEGCEDTRDAALQIAETEYEADVATCKLNHGPDATVITQVDAVGISAMSYE